MSEVRAGHLPYTGAPEIAPRFATAQYQNIPTNPREFGAGIGAAEEKLGAGLQHVSNVFGQIAADDQVNQVQKGFDDLTAQFAQLHGKDALDQQDAYRQKVTDLLTQGRGNLTDAQQQVEFEQQTRYLYSRSLREMSAHADQQRQVWATGVNKSAADLAITNAANAAAKGDAEGASRYTQDLVRARVRQAQTVYGADPGPDIINDAIRGANADSAKMQVMAMIPTNPVGAKALLDKNSEYFSGLEYEALSQRLQGHLNRAIEDSEAARIWNGGKAPAGLAPLGFTGGFSWQQMAPHLQHFESSGRADAYNPTPTSSGNASGLYGITSGTWRQYAPQAGVDVAKYPEARAAPADLQNRVGEAIYNARGLQPWETWRQALTEAGGHPPQRGEVKLAEAAGGAAAPAAQPAADTQPPIERQAPSLDDMLMQINPDLPEEQQVGIARRLTRDYRYWQQSTHAERSALKQSLAGGVAMLQDGRQYQWDEPQIRYLFPKDQADQMIDLLHDAQEVGQQKQNLAGMTVSQALTQSAANHSVLQNAPPAEYPKLKRMSDAFDQAMAARNKALGLDPAATVLAENPAVERARQAAVTETPQQAQAEVAAGKPTATETFANTMLDAQSHIGVPPDMQHVLDRVSAQGRAADIIANPEGAPEVLKGYAQAYGSAWPQVFRDLVTLGKLPAAYQMVGALDNAADGALLARGLAEANKEGVSKSLATLIDKGATGTSRPSQAIRSYIEGKPEIDSYVHSMAASGASPDQIAGIVSSIGLLAQAKMLWGGATNPAQAAQDAITSAIGKWEFMPNGGARIPRENAPAITADAEHTVAGLKLGDLQAPAIFRPQPPDFDTQHAAGMIRPGNVDPWNRPVLHNPDGSYSTTSSISIGTDAGETLIPTVINGVRFSNEAAIAHYQQTGENLGTFRTPAEADAYATALHNAQASMFDSQGNPKGRAPGLATADDWLRTLQASPSWVTVGNSIRLMDNGGRFVRRSSGFVEVPFSAAPPPAAQLPPAQPGIVP